MIGERELEDAKKLTEELLLKMTILDCLVQVGQENVEAKADEEPYDIIVINLTSKEPQFLIGQNGQNLLDLQKVLRLLLIKKMSRLQDNRGSSTESGQKNLYLKVDINEYQKQKIEYLKNLARSSADEVVLTKKEKPLPFMSAYERRIIHEELSKRQDVITESHGDNSERRVIVVPK